MAQGGARKRRDYGVCSNFVMRSGDDPKQKARDSVRRDLRALDPEARLEASRRVVETILRSPLWAAADTLFAFVSLPDEVETTDLCAQALREKKRLGLPRFGEEGLVFYRVEDLDRLRVDNSLAIRQPSRELPELSSTRHPRQPGRLLIVTPGRAFTESGERLGRGGGFYDAFFGALRKGHIVYQAVGICFDQQLLPEIPATEHDERVHAVVTPTRSFGIL